LKNIHYQFNDGFYSANVSVVSTDGRKTVEKCRGNVNRIKIIIKLAMNVFQPPPLFTTLTESRCGFRSSGFGLYLFPLCRSDRAFGRSSNRHLIYISDRTLSRPTESGGDRYIQREWSATRHLVVSGQLLKRVVFLPADAIEICPSRGYHGCGQRVRSARKKYVIPSGYLVCNCNLRTRPALCTTTDRPTYLPLLHSPHLPKISPSDLRSSPSSALACQHSRHCM
jgi:hypothetical protein